MSLREVVSKVFSKEKEPPHKAWENENLSTEEKWAVSNEIDAQIQAHQQRKAASWSQDMIEERQKAALEHARLDHTPDGVSQVQAKSLIETRASNALLRKNQIEENRIPQRPARVILAEVKDREAQASRQEKGAPATESDHQPGRHEPIEVTERRNSVSDIAVQQGQMIPEIGSEQALAPTSGDYPMPDAREQAELDAMRAQMEARDREGHEPGHEL